jgi:hypothetical protein
LYSINVFLTFSLSQLGMVKHWWEVRRTDPRWSRNMGINGIGLLLTSTILVATICLKFREGGWLTLVITTSLVVTAMLIKQHYTNVRKLLQRLDSLLAQSLLPSPRKEAKPAPDQAPTLSASPSDKTAIILVKGFGGLGLHTTFGVMRTFRGHFKNFVFIEAGLIDAGQFKGVAEIEHLRKTIEDDLDRYVQLMRGHGFHAEGLSSLGTEVVDEVETLAVQVTEHYPNSIVFTGQLVFPQETLFTRILHNYTAFAIQKRLYYHGIPVFILPIRVEV